MNAEQLRTSKQGMGRYILIYSATFVVLAAMSFSFFFLNGKAFVYQTDGLRQHFTSLAYYGHYLREIIRTLLTEHSLQIPMFDFHIGLGSDIITTLHYYVIGDPLNLLSVFVPMKYTEYLFCFLVLLRIYLAGLAFSAFSFYQGNGRKATLFGAIIYAFSVWALYTGVRHPYFVNPMIYSPLIFIGIDKIYKKEKPYLFMGMTAIAGLSNFYFFYMICIFMFIYAAYRYFMLFPKRSVPDVLCWLGKFIGYFAVGFAIAAVLLLPVIAFLTGTGRFGEEHPLPSGFGRKYYEMFLGSLMGKVMSRYTAVGVTAVGLLGILVLFIKRKKNIALKAAYGMMLCFLMVPFAGHVFNGFSYATNRWTWAYVLLAAYINVKAFPEFFTLKRKERRILYLAVIVYCGLALIGEAGHNVENLGQIALLFITCAGVCALSHFGNIRRTLPALLGISLVAGVFINAWGLTMEGDRPSVDTYIPYGKALSRMQTAPAKAVKQAQAGDEDFFRYDQANAGEVYNSSLLSRLNSTGYFFSLVAPSVSQFKREMYANTAFDQSAMGLDSRVILDRLSSVRYFAVGEGEEAHLPYGYTTPESTASKNGSRVEVFSTEDSLPLGYTYDSYMPRSEYEKLDVVKKQETLLQAVVLDDSRLQEGTPSYDSRELPCTITAGEGCQISGGEVKVRKRKAKLTFKFQGLPESETYLIVEGMDFEGVSPRARYTQKEFDALPKEKQETILKKEKYWAPTGWLDFSVSSGKARQELDYITENFNFYCGRHDFIANMGYNKAGLTELTLTLEKEGNYSFDGLRIACQPVKSLDAYTRDRKEDVLEDVLVGTNKITGAISLDKEKALVFSIPYSDGWRLYVDGEPRELKEANTMYMAAELPPGKHSVELRYRTPYILPGFCLCITGILAFLAIIYYHRIRKK